MTLLEARGTLLMEMQMVEADVDRRVLFAQVTTDGDLSGQLYCSRYFRMESVV